MPFADNYQLKYPLQFIPAREVVEPFQVAIIIPCYYEFYIIETIRSVLRSSNIGLNVALIIVINSPENCAEEISIQNEKTFLELNNLSLVKGFDLFVIYAKDLPEKHAGVGWARKIGMDWAISCFNKFENPDGIMVSLDADTLVSENYLEAIVGFFEKEKKAVGATIYFEHTTQGNEQVTPQQFIASVKYELYMRYYKHALNYVGFPYSFYTVGSAFCVKAFAYTAQGGMNRRKAGEDFYFLHKLTSFGFIGEVKSATVYPSIRISDRVPFGTGPIIKRMVDQFSDSFKTFSFDSFVALKDVFKNVERFFIAREKLKVEDFTQNAVLQHFINHLNLVEEVRELASNCSVQQVFAKRFFQVFDGLTVLKWLNFAHQNGYGQGELLKEAELLLNNLGVQLSEDEKNPEKMLNIFRSIDKTN
jgi:hypothetical protein